MIPGDARADDDLIQRCRPGHKWIRLESTAESDLNPQVSQRLNLESSDLFGFEHRDLVPLGMEKSCCAKTGATKSDNNAGRHRNSWPRKGMGDTGFEPVTPTMSM